MVQYIRIRQWLLTNLCNANILTVFKCESLVLIWNPNERPPAVASFHSGPNFRPSLTSGISWICLLYTSQGCVLYVHHRATSFGPSDIRSRIEAMFGGTTYFGRKCQ